MFFQTQGPATGNLTADPTSSVVDTDDGELELAEFTVALDSPLEDQDGENETVFVDVTVYGEDNVQALRDAGLQQGSTVNVDGNLYPDSYSAENEDGEYVQRNLQMKGLEPGDGLEIEPADEDKDFFRVEGDGRLTEDPEASETKNGSNKAKVRVALDTFGENSDTVFINMAAFNETAGEVYDFDNDEPVLEKGDPLKVSGAPNPYDIENDGTRYVGVSLMANEIGEADFATSQDDDAGVSEEEATEAEEAPESVPDF